jgi:LytS/YehU family sensor histidine kinase
MPTIILISLQVLNSLLGISMLIAISIGIYLFIRWREQSIKEKQQFENDRIRFQLDTLRNQIQPHFLFNSFNTLAGIIETNPEKAVIFVEKLSDFYRDLLNYREKNLIPISEELKLLENYIFLIEQRFIGKIKFEIQIPLEILSLKIAPLCLQLLIENAIKHNTTSREKPLLIKIYKEDDFLVVQNIIQLKAEEVVSTGIGLQNILKRYEILSKNTLQILDDKENFIVKIPLIN